MLALNFALLYFSVAMTINAFRLKLNSFLVSLPMMAALVCAIFVIRAISLGF